MYEPSKIRKSATESVAAQFLAELERAYADVKIYMVELAEVLDLPQLDRARLTTVRLKLAQLRLVQGGAVGRIYRHLIANSDETHRNELEEMHSNHLGMLNMTSAHTTKWTLDAIEAEWPEYVKAARAIVHFGLEKMNAEQKTLISLLKRDACI